MKFESQYNIGDIVFQAGTLPTRKRFPCPDCLDTKEWKAISPAGTEYSFSCPRCSATYLFDKEMRLDYMTYVPSVATLTIVSVRYNSESGYEYMCEETGVGSGQVHKETTLFQIKANAEKASKLMAAKQNRENVMCVDQYAAALRVSDYQLKEVVK
jgi:hypothetical protein